MSSESLQRLLIIKLKNTPIPDIMSVTFDGSKYMLHHEIARNWVAKANFTDNTNNDGWSYLEVETNPNYPDTIQSYAAGFVEGASSSEIIYLSYRNTAEGFCKWKGKEFCDRLNDFLLKNNNWMKSMLAIKNRTCPVWHNVELILNQLQGVNDGYNATGKETMEEGAVLLMNLMGDIEDLSSVLEPKQHKSNIEDWNKGRVTGDGHCSALIKVLRGNTDLYVSHVTWNTTPNNLKITSMYLLTTIDTNFHGPKYRIAFSVALHSSHLGFISLNFNLKNSVPGFLKLVFEVPTRHFMLFWHIVKGTQKLLEWMRVIVANRISTSGKMWTDFFSMHNSGTYNNQWMVVDYKQFRPFHHIKALEQFFVKSDKHNIIAHLLFWQSWNAILYVYVFHLSGIRNIIEKSNVWHGAHCCPNRLLRREYYRVYQEKAPEDKIIHYWDRQLKETARCSSYHSDRTIFLYREIDQINSLSGYDALDWEESRSKSGILITLNPASQMLLQPSPRTFLSRKCFRRSRVNIVTNEDYVRHIDRTKFLLLIAKWLCQ
ncbi:unnamed protein product, partial [Meganyctiphanes norvegica]